MQKRDQSKARSGTTLVETLISSMMIATALGLIVEFRAKSVGVQIDQIYQAKALLAIASTREIVGSWDFDHVTAEAIQSLPMNEELVTQNLRPKWFASVEEIDEPIIGKRVTLGMYYAESSDRKNEGIEFDRRNASLPKLDFWLASQENFRESKRNAK